MTKTYRLNIYLHLTYIGIFMHIKHIFIFLVFFILALTDVSAQTMPFDPQKKVSEYSDQEIQLALQKVQTSGYSEADMYAYLTQQGMPATEIEALKRRVEIVKVSGGNIPKLVTKDDTTKYTRDAIAPVVPPVITERNLIYGYDYFTNPKQVWQPNTWVSTPTNYILGPGDELIINVTGINERTFNPKMSPDGNIRIPSAGLIYLNGFTIEQARSQIRTKLTQIYPLLASGQTKLTVNLGNNRTILITVNGEVIKPGNYRVSSLATFFNVLYLTGGPSKIGSLRNIEIIRNNKVLRTIDFYPFLNKSLLSNDIRLEDQDVIHFPVYQKRIAIDGEIKRPGLYELLETETLDDLIQYAGGFSDRAYRSTAKITQIGSKERSFRNVSSDLFDSYKPKNADSINFEAISDRYTNRIVIEGAVFRPGDYELTTGLNLRQLIQQADGLREDAFLDNVLIKRISAELNKEMKSYNLRNGIPDVPLMRDDSVIVFSIKDLRDESRIVVDGFVRSPGIFTYRSGMKFSDAIAMAGGFTDEAARHNVKIYRNVRNRADTVTNELTTIIPVNAELALSGNESVLLEPLDRISVPRLVNSRSPGNVTIEGEILFPGNYVLERRDESALDLIKRAGGLTPAGSLINTQIYRNGRRVEMDFTGSETSLTAAGLVLVPGDSILVPRENPFVEVSGAVNSPQLIKYSGRSFKYYVNAAGGTKENARLKGAYIQYANGTNRAVDRFLIFRDYPAVEPGSKIIVPIKSGPPRISIAEIGVITSAVTALISVIAIILANK